MKLVINDFKKRMFDIVTHCVCHRNELWAIFEEHFDDIRVIVFCRQVERRLTLLRSKKTINHRRKLLLGQKAWALSHILRSHAWEWKSIVASPSLLLPNLCQCNHPMTGLENLSLSHPSETSTAVYVYVYVLAVA